MDFKQLKEFADSHDSRDILNIAINNIPAHIVTNILAHYNDNKKGPKWLARTIIKTDEYCHKTPLPEPEELYKIYGEDEDDTEVQSALFQYLSLHDEVALDMYTSYPLTTQDAMDRNFDDLLEIDMPAKQAKVLIMMKYHFCDMDSVQHFIEGEASVQDLVKVIEFIRKKASKTSHKRHRKK